MSINIEQLKQLLDLVREHDLSEFEIENEGLRLKLRKDAPGGSAATSGVVAAVSQGAGSSVSAVPSSGSPVPQLGSEDADVELAVVKSPIVGTFYRSPEPGAPPFVEIGSTVRKGDVLCIIEAMKLMNEIDSEYDGEVVAIYVDGGQPVQYGERLYAIRTK